MINQTHVLANQPLAMGCMQLSTIATRNDDENIRVIHAALDTGVRFFDTANVYCHDDDDLGHNERLLTSAIKSWDGDTSSVLVATKGGLTRPKGRWIPDGRAKSLRAACEASRKALDVNTVDLYQLHTVDPKTPFLTSIRALAALQRDGLCRYIGLCNVTVEQIRAARDVLEVACVQVELNPLQDECFRNGVAEYCRDNDLPIIAARPLSGKQLRKLRRDKTLVAIADRHDATPEEIVLAWLRDLYRKLVPIPGVSSLKSVRSLEHVPRITLASRDRRELDSVFPAGRLLRVPLAHRRPPTPTKGEVVVIMGAPGSGKSILAEEFVVEGYTRLNRDTIGGSLKGLVPRLEAGFEAGTTTWVLDNTYPTRASRNYVVETAWKHRASVRCIWLRSEPAETQMNAVIRMVRQHGTLPTPEEIQQLAKTDPRMFGPDALYRYTRSLEPPSIDEGFASVDERAAHRLVFTGEHRAIFVDIDAMIRHADRNAVARKLQRCSLEQWSIIGFAWRPQIETGELTIADVKQELDAFKKTVGLTLSVSCCPHKAGPPKCWCRIPLPGLLVETCERERVNPEISLLIGDSPADKTLAHKMQMNYSDLDGWMTIG